MLYEMIGITILWALLYGYVIVASIDFGAGFFSYYGKLKKKDHLINDMVNRYLTPVWEVTNVFFIYIFVGLVGFFPKAAYYYGTTLLVPGSVALILLTIRGTFYAFADYGARESTVYRFLYGVTGLLTPAALSTVLTISEGGFIREGDDGGIEFVPQLLFASPYSWTVVLLAIVSVLFISASFLTYYASRAEDKEAMELLRQFALWWSGPTIFASILVFSTLRIHNAFHFTVMLHYSWMFLLSFLFFMGAVYLIIQRKALGTAFIMVMLQFGFAFFGYGISHLPYLLFPYVTIESGSTNPQMGLSLVIVFMGGLFLLIFSLYLLFRHFLYNANVLKGQAKS
ncbi:cytochrome d ubiquinol oxidase subunit II [Aneurinibacillus terranovensis]|uniref:cytochrome d ubiquinol oxidase subunit II n=1 Tax=Aneurinibacillus terranovensis TaxID=278991 RepID=UPI000412096B|nr:cytochrome d ubiquinol oxidase subunit II [Aneurinibacillus terranovensis]